MSRWERILLVLGVCLPVPLLAATGLSIPLPATVERVAAGLVPFAQAATLAQDDARHPRGVILRAPGEAAPEIGSESSPFFTPVDSGASDQPGDSARKSRPDKGQAPTSNTTGRPEDDSRAPAAPGDPKPTPGNGGTSSPPPPQPQPEPQPRPQPGPEPQPQPQPEPAPQPQPPSPPPPPPPPPPSPEPLPVPLPVPLPPPPPLLPPPPPPPDLGL